MTQPPSGHRRLLVFAPAAGREALVRQIELLEGHKAATEDRNLLLESFLEDGSETSAAARSRFGVEDGTFAAILVGKDGGEKYRSAEPIAPRKLLDLIDAMPMRQREIRSRAPR